MVKKIISSLHFPKSMRWGNGNIRFVRPIHWILALIDGETIPFEIDGIRSGNITRGHRFLSPGLFVIREIPSYVNLLENNCVVVDQDERRKTIIDGMTKLCSAAGWSPLIDEDLLETVTYLVEYPVPVLCEFPADYLSLPRELLVTVMKDHQKYFAVENKDGRLGNNFIVISNTKAGNSEAVKGGAERVIKARFEDARFYYEEDIKKPLHSRINDLKRVTFHDRLGSLYDKTERVIKLASFLSEKLFPQKKESIERAAWLSKTDLITGVVGEFPELQGIMGRYYALHDEENTAVADAIMEHYLPVQSGGRLPETDEGSVLSLADKIDNIVSFFGIGHTPSGSEDPFALRRQALAVIAILMEKGYDITLGEMVAKAAEGPGNMKASVSDDVLTFFLQRIEPLLSKDYAFDIIQSVLGMAGSMTLKDIIERIHAIAKFKGEDGYNSFLLSIKRINNIVPKTDLPAPRPDLLTDDREQILYNDIKEIRQTADKMLLKRDYLNALRSMSSLTASINNFFDGVLVMDRREEIKLNRLALLKEIWTTASSIADFSKLAEK